eukprot:g7350.t1
MGSQYQPDLFPSDYGPPQPAPANVQGLKARIKYFEERIALLKEIKKDGDARLAAQDAEIKVRNREIEEMKEKFRNDLLKKDKILSDAALSVRTRERKIVHLNDQHCKATMAIQRMQLSKHQIVATAKKEVREERAEREQREATLDAQNKAAGRSYNSRGIMVSKDTGRRISSRASTGGGPGKGSG